MSTYPFELPTPLRASDRLRAESTSPIRGSPSPGLSHLMSKLSISEAQTAGTEYFLLPRITENYLSSHPIADWLKLWRDQIEQNRKDCIKLTEIQLKRIFCAHIDLPWRDEIIKVAMEEDLAKTITVLEEKCKSHSSFRLPQLPFPKQTNENFTDYLRRLVLHADTTGYEYKDPTLVRILYALTPPNIRPVIEAKWQTMASPDLAALIDREIDIREGLEVPSELHPFMMPIMEEEAEDSSQIPVSMAIKSGYRQPKKPVCFYCGRAGHIWKECKDRKANKPPKDPRAWERFCRKSSRGRSKRKGHINAIQVTKGDNEVVHPIMYLPVTLNGRPVHAMIDTGSQVTAVSQELYNQLPDKPVLNTTGVYIQAANDLKMDVVGEITASVWIAEAELEVRLPCLVMRKLAAPFIISYHGLKVMGMIINPIDDTITCRKYVLHTSPSMKPPGATSSAIIQDPKLSAEQQAQIEKLIEENPNTFVNELKIGDPVPGVEHHIELTTDQPIAMKLRRYSPKEEAQIKQAVDELKKLHILRPSKSPYCAQALVVAKHDGSPRLVINFQALNAVTKKDKFPLPVIPDIIREIGDAKYYTTLDLASGFFQFKMREEDMEKTAFSINGEHLEYTRMPMGLTNSPATMQRAMTKIMTGLLHKGVQVFVDDILIYSKTWEEHIALLTDVVNRLRANNLQVKLKKCSFAKDEVKYLGYIIGHGAKRPDPDKVQAIREMPAPQNAKDLRSFLGMVGFYREFIKDLGTMTVPLNALLKKNVTFSWGEEQQQAFQKIKDRLADQIMLEIPAKDGHYEVHTDASTTGIGAVLVQRDKHGVRHIIECASKALGPAQSKQGIPALECYAIMWALRKFRPYLHGTHFTVITDHFGLKFLQTKENPSATLQRWWWELYDFDFDVIYRKGENNIADSFSRLISKKQLEEENAKDWQELEDMGILMALSTKNFIAEKILSKKIEGKTTYYLVKWQGYSPKDATWETKYSVRNNKLVRDFERLWQEKQRKLQDERDSTVVNNIGKDELHQLQEQDPWCRHIMQIIDKKEQPENPYETRDANQCLIKDSLLFHKSTVQGEERLQIVIPETLRNRVISLIHSSIIGAHMGVSRTVERIGRIFWWRSMKQNIKDFVRACPICNERKGDPHQAPLAPEPRVDRPFFRIGIDYMELPVSSKGNKYIFVVIDHATKFVEALACDNQRADTAANFIFSNVICRYGAPQEILSDRGQAFTGEVMTILSKLCGISQKFTAGYHPQTNGLTERFNRTIQEVLSKFVNSAQTNWDDLLQPAVFAYNTSIHSSTGYTPFEMVHGFLPTMPVGAELIIPRETKQASEWVKTIHDQARVLQAAGFQKQTRRAKSQQKQYNKGKRMKHIRIGDLVRVNMGQNIDPQTKKLARVWKGPYTILSRCGPVSFRVINNEGFELPDAVHINRLMKISDAEAQQL